MDTFFCKIYIKLVKLYYCFHFSDQFIIQFIKLSYFVFGHQSHHIKNTLRQILTSFHFIFDKYLRTDILFINLKSVFPSSFFYHFLIFQETQFWKEQTDFELRICFVWEIIPQTFSIVAPFYCSRNSLLQVFSNHNY